MLTLASCNSDDDVVPTFIYEGPDWEENVVFIDATNTPTVQINRFVAANNMDTVMTASGLVYAIQNPGETEKPTATSTVQTWYKGYLTDGRVFDQTFTAPAEFSLDGALIQGWKEGIPKIGKGGRMWLLVRPSLGYGNSPPASSPIITDNTVLVFEIELEDFE